MKQFVLAIVLFINFSNCKQFEVKKDNLVSINKTDREFLAEGELVKSKKKIEILLPTQYRKENGYPKNTDKKDWYALYFDEKSNVWKTENTILTLNYGMDNCVGDSVMIIENFKNALLFIRGLNELNETPLTALSNKMLLPDRNLSFELSGKSYQFYAVGNYMDENENYLPTEVQKLKSEEELKENSIGFYQLSFSHKDGAIQLIATKEKIQSDGNTPRLLWAGDLNGDELPDLIIDIADWYESREIQLFLSDDKNNNQVLEKIAELWVVNDC